VGVVQGVLFLGGMIILGVLAVNYAGGLTALNQSLAVLAAAPAPDGLMTRGYGGGDYNGMFVIPGVIQWTAGEGVESALGGPWTAVMGLSFALTLMGLQLAPGFSVWSFASRSPRGFSISQIWGSAACVGAALFMFSTLQGIAAHVLGASGAANAVIPTAQRLLPELSAATAGDLVLNYIRLTATEQPWLTGLLAVAAVAALQSTAAAYMATAGNIVARDLYRRHIDENSDWRQQKTMASIFMLLLCLAALMMASFAMQATLVLATLAIPFAFQLLPSLAGVLWLPWITRRAATFGLVIGLVVVVLTEPLGQVLTGSELPWGRWPWTIHSGVWGMFFNVCVCVATVFFSRSDVERERRNTYHDFYRSLSFANPRTPRMKSVAWIILLIWLFFGPGPGAIIGNRLFGNPAGGFDSWIFGVPSIWAWQVFWWALGVGVVWFLAERMRFSKASDQELALARDNITIGATHDR
jgi:Na+/proline symporter